MSKYRPYSCTGAYETGAFHDLCDELGILVWQDFMFANLDYPPADERFRASVTREAGDVLATLGARPSLVVLCVRRAGVRFAAECLAFSHVPPAETIEEMLPSAPLRASLRVALYREGERRVEEARVPVELGQLLAASAPTSERLIVLGGLVPPTLARTDAPEVPAHLGTTDVDILLVTHLTAGHDLGAIEGALEVRGCAHARC